MSDHPDVVALENLADAYETLWIKHREIADLVCELFGMLDWKEESDSGRVFSPTYITSCRAMHCARLHDLLPRLKELCK